MSEKDKTERVKPKPKEWVQPSWYGTPKYWEAVKSRDKNLRPSTSMGL